MREGRAANFNLAAGRVFVADWALLTIHQLVAIPPDQWGKYASIAAVDNSKYVLVWLSRHAVSAIVGETLFGLNPASWRLLRITANCRCERRRFQDELPANRPPVDTSVGKSERLH
jgi:hypothetical protein